MVVRQIGNLSCMLTVLISLLRLGAATHKGTHEVPVPVPVPELSPDYDRFLIDCTEKVSPECGEELVATMTLENETIADVCCENLLAMGKSCHDILVRYIAEEIVGERKFNGNEALAKYMEKGEQMWKKCASLARVLHASL